MTNPAQQLDIRDHREKDWFWSNNGIIEWYGEIIGADSVAVYMVLCRHANQAGECWPSYQTIATKLKLSRPTVIKCMKKLEAAQVIAKSDRTQPTKDGGSMPDSNMYLLLTVKPLDEPSKAALLGLVNDIDHPPSKGALPHLVKELYHPSKGALPKQDSLNKTHRTRDEKRADRAPRTPPIPKQTNLDSFNQAVLAYKELSGKKQLPPVTTTLIVNRVSDVEKWRAAVNGWIACGFNPGNVNDMLDWYDHPEKMAARLAKNGQRTNERIAPTAKSAPAYTPPTDIKPPHEVAARMKELIAQQRNRE